MEQMDALLDAICDGAAAPTAAQLRGTLALSTSSIAFEHASYPDAPIAAFGGDTGAGSSADPAQMALSLDGAATVAGAVGSVRSGSDGAASTFAIVRNGCDGDVTVRVRRQEETSAWWQWLHASLRGAWHAVRAGRATLARRLAAAPWTTHATLLCAAIASVLAAALLGNACAARACVSSETRSDDPLEHKTCATRGAGDAATANAARKCAATSKRAARDRPLGATAAALLPGLLRAQRAPRTGARSSACEPLLDDA